MFEVRFTADRITEESASEGLAAENGFIVPNWSMRKIVADSEVVPETFETRKDAVEHIERTIGAVYADGGDRFYSEDEDLDFATGDRWMYAGHITEK